jgi:imidazolonepropionase-like amidohydrolase
MKRQSLIGSALLAFAFGGSSLAAENPRTVVIHAGQMFDSKAERLASKQVIVIQGERIADVGPEGSVKIPPGAEEIDLSAATVLPGLIEGHNHMFKIGDHAGADSGASVPAEIKPGSPGYVTLLAAKNAKLDLESGENIGRSDRVGAIEKGKYADIIAVSGNPAVDVTEMERVKFVMKGGQVYRKDLKGSATVSQR